MYSVFFSNIKIRLSKIMPCDINSEIEMFKPDSDIKLFFPRAGNNFLLERLPRRVNKSLHIRDNNVKYETNAALSRDIFALRDISLLHTTECIPHFIYRTSRRAISGMQHSRLPRRFHRDEKIARACMCVYACVYVCAGTNGGVIFRTPSVHFNPFPSRKREDVSSLAKADLPE